MGLGPQDVDVDCCSEGSRELLDTHEVGELLDTGDSSSLRHERRACTATVDRMQAGCDDADEGQPADEAAVHCSAGTENGGDAHVGVRSLVQGHARQDAAQDSGEVQGTAGGGGCVLGLGGTGEHRGMAAAVRRQAAERQGQTTDGVESPGGGGRGLGRHEPAHIP